MRILVLAALYPPNAHGGAEISAWNLTNWLARQGHEVAVMTAAAPGQDEMDGEDRDGVRIWRVRTPHLYPVYAFPAAPGWQKPIWHVQDHFDPRNRLIMRRVLDRFQPDFVNIHLVQGLGHNALAEVGARKLPALYVLPDLGLACIRMSMFRNGVDCPSQCGACRLSQGWKTKQLRHVDRLGFLSPSASNLAALELLGVLGRRPRAVIMNPNRYPPPSDSRQAATTLRLLYVGRLHETKGVDVLLAALEPLGEIHDLHLTVLGSGQAETAMFQRYGRSKWVAFHGQVGPTQVSDEMQNADLLCVPSLWRENAPGVIVQALSLGLPVLASRRGGIMELVRDDWNGALVEAGDVDAWRAALEAIMAEPARLSAWRRNAGQDAASGQFDQDRLGARIFAFMRAIADRLPFEEPAPRP